MWDEVWIGDGKMERDLVPERIGAVLSTSAVALTPPASPSRFESRISVSGWEAWEAWDHLIDYSRTAILAPTQRLVLPPVTL
jgi:hypothetical protein